MTTLFTDLNMLLFCECWC